jgi:bacterioferritin (cytochrome b1)
VTAAEFVAALEAENQARLRGLEPDATLTPEVKGALNVPNLLKVALRNEAEATVIAARWIPGCGDTRLMLSLARQAADEAKHYELIAKRLGELGFDADTIDPLAGGVGPLTKYLETLTTDVERVAAGQFTREAIAIVKNRQFIDFCERVGDKATAALYRDTIEPDERHHQELGRKTLLRLATTPETQAAARSAARRTLELADELQKKALATAGIHHAPGC